MKILLNKEKDICELKFERRDKQREQLVSVRGLYNALCASFGGCKDINIHEIDEYMANYPYKDIIDKAMKAGLDDDPAFDKFKELPLDTQKIVIRRLYAVIACYCKDFTI